MKVILLATQISAGILFLDIMAQIIMVSVNSMLGLRRFFFDIYSNLNLISSFRFLDVTPSAPNRFNTIQVYIQVTPSFCFPIVKN